MNHKQALEMRKAINILFRLTHPERYCVAIEDRYPEGEDDNSKFELHLYLREPNKSGQIELALLARAIEDLGTHFLSMASTYDAGTKKGEDIRQSVKIW